jgi:hypothetical protein
MASPESVTSAGKGLVLDGSPMLGHRAKNLLIPGEEMLKKWAGRGSWRISSRADARARLADNREASE